MDLTLVTHKPPTTGFGRYAHGLAHALWALGHAPTLIELDARRRVLHHHRPEGTETEKVPGPAVHPFLFYRRAWKQADVEGPVHVTNQHLAWLDAEKKIVTVHDLYYLQHGPAWRRLPARFLYRFLHDADAALVTCATQADELRCLAPDIPIHIAPPGVLPRARPAPRPSRRRDLLHVGTADRRKNLEPLVDAMRHLPKDVRLVQAGAPTDRTRGRLQGRSHRDGTHRRIDWRGRVDDVMLDDLYRYSMVLVQPSRYEGFGYPAFEAMAAGTPVVASRIPVFEDLLGDASTLVEPRPHDLAAAVSELLEDAKGWGHASRRASRLAERFSWPEVAPKAVAAYEEVLE